MRPGVKGVRHGSCGRANAQSARANLPDRSNRRRPFREAGHVGFEGTFRPAVAARDHRRRPGRVDRPHASRRGRDGRLVANGGGRLFQRSGALPRRRRRDGVRRGTQLRRRGRNAGEGEAQAGRRRRGRHHDAQRFALPICRGGTGRRARRRRRQARDPRLRAGVRPGRARPTARTPVRGRPRLCGLSDDAVRAHAGPQRRARPDPAGAGRIHPERPGDARRGRSAEQPLPLDPRSAAQRPSAGAMRSTLPASPPISPSTALSPTSARWSRAARSSTTCRRWSRSTAAPAARSP